MHHNIDVALHVNDCPLYESLELYLEYNEKVIK